MAEGPVIITDGSIDFSGGVNSIAVTTIQSDRNPNGLPRNCLAWLNNASVRDGGITPRFGWQPLATLTDGTALFQGKFMYEPRTADVPYEVYSIGGHIYRKDVDSGGMIDLTAMFPGNVPQFNPPNEPLAFFVQGEEFLIIQAGDNTTLPFFWDGVTLRRSIGITNPAPALAPGQNEIPAAGPMEYYMGRIWYAQGRTVSAGDIVKGPSGTLAYQFRDAILNVTENPLSFGGDGFTVPSNSGNIRAIKHSANIDKGVGEGRLFVSTRRTIYALNVPVTRADWIAANNSNQPLMTVVQLANGWVGDRSVVAVNGDLYGQSLEPGIRSLNQSTRLFGQPGNIEISANEHRILKYNNRALLRFSTGIYFDNRMLQSALPRQLPQGVVHDALIPLDFVPISTFNRQKEPNWEGMYQGLQILQMNTGDFGGRQRAFATIVSDIDSSIQLWELTDYSKTENGDNRVTMIMEFPAFTWGDETRLKKLVGAELWIDRLFGTVAFAMEWRPDGQACWNLWHSWKKCSTKNSPEDVANPSGYPLTPCLESYFATMTLPKPPENCASATGRPAHIAYQIQCRLTMTGFARVRGIYLHAEPFERKLYANITC